MQNPQYCGLGKCPFVNTVLYFTIFFDKFQYFFQKKEKNSQKLSKKFVKFDIFSKESIKLQLELVENH